jgi:hypothetical protein
MNVIPVAIPEAVYDAVILAVGSVDELVPTVGMLGVQNFLIWTDLDYPATAIALLRGADEVTP